jgi:hypothetical protein
MPIKTFIKEFVHVFIGAMVFFLSASLAAELGPVPESVKVNEYPKIKTPFDISSLKPLWRQRIEAVKASGRIPIIDIESSYNPNKLDPKTLAEQMDKNGVALIAMSAGVRRKKFHSKGKVWSDATLRLMNLDPWRYIPASTGGAGPAWSEGFYKFLDKTIEKVTEDNYPLLGEFEFRHYPSVRQYKRGEMYRDVSIPIYSRTAEKLFSFSEKSGLSFQIHYEIEDRLLPPLEEILKKYPKAKVIWCHLGHIRYQERSSIYTPQYVRSLIETFPNLYFDLAIAGPNSIYPGSGEYHARVWNRKTEKVKQEWVDLIKDHPWRFLAALDLGGDKMDKLPYIVRRLRHFFKSFPKPIREIIAYKAAWKLLFDEEV